MSSEATSTRAVGAETANTASLAADSATRRAPRIAALDRARGFAMACIVIGHFYVTDRADLPVYRFVYAFHVPLFFFMSGLLFKAPAGDLARSLMKRLRNVMQPYLIWAVLSVAVFSLLGPFAASVLGRRGGRHPLWRELWNIVYANPSSAGMDWNRPLWFLPAIALAYIIATLLTPVLRSSVGAAVVFVLSVPISLLAADAHMRLPWSGERVLTLLPFFFAGYLLRGQTRRLADIPSRARAPLAVGGVVLFALMQFIASRNGTVEYINKVYGDDRALFFLAAALGIAATVMISTSLLGATPWERAGRDSLTVLCWHKFFVVAIQLVAIKLALVNHVEEDILVVMGGLLALMCSLVAKPVVQRIWPAAAGVTTGGARG